MKNDVMQLIIALLSGGVIQYVAQYYIAKRKQSYTEVEMIIKTWAEDNERLRKTEKENRDRIDSLESQISLLRAQIVALESIQLDLPIPMWLKDLNGLMMSLNKPYENAFLKPRKLTSVDYIGKSDSNVWSDDVCLKFKISDSYVKTNKDLHYSIVDIPFDTYSEKWIVVKYPRILNNELIGVGGLSIPYNSVLKYNAK